MSNLHVILIAVFQAMFGFGLGMWFQATRTIKAMGRRDEAARFEKGDVITFGDGSAIVVESLAPSPSTEKR